MPQTFKKFIWYSMAVHAAFFIFILVSPDFAKFLPESKHKVTWVKLSKGTGSDPSLSPFKKSKGMPYSTVKEQKEALKEIAWDKKGSDMKSIASPTQKKEPLPPTKQKTAPQGGIDFTKKPADPNDRTIDDALARVQDELKKREVEIEAAQIEKEGTGQSPYGSLNMENGETNPALVAYFGEVKRKINEEWITTPKALAEGEVLKAEVNLIINALGGIVSATYETQSGNAAYDLSAMRAVERAAPFPPPPDIIRAEVLAEGFLIEFSPRSVVGQFQ
ncbi:MAG: TonB family protein [Deltaproteobacteria bacterium]|nr:TonB family protein [Deltaproteobacteria bacterium]